MLFLTFLEAIIKLGIPMVILSWSIFTLLYGEGRLDRKANRKSTHAQVKKIKKTFVKKKKGGGANYVVDKWMWFGSGFYGLAALWTFAVIEILEIIRVVLNPYSIIEAFADGVVSALIDLAINQFSNLLSAFVWFGYWSDDGVIPWLIVAYVGYWIGVEMARREEDLQLQPLLERIRSRLPKR
jgi:hypothetical protein